MEKNFLENSKKQLKNALLTTTAIVGLANPKLSAQASQNHKPANTVEMKHGFKVFQYYQEGQGNVEQMKAMVAPMLLGYSVEMVNQIEASHNHERLVLVKVTVADLGFKNGATYNQILKRANELGLKVCPAEAGIGIRLQYTNQPVQDKFYIAMSPIVINSHGDNIPSIFEVRREGESLHSQESESYLLSHTVGQDADTESDWVFGTNESFVFVQ